MGVRFGGTGGALPKALRALLMPTSLLPRRMLNCPDLAF